MATAATPRVAPTAIPAVAPVERPDEDGGSVSVGGGIDTEVDAAVVDVILRMPESGSPATVVIKIVFVYPWMAAQPKPIDPPSYWYSAQYGNEVGP